MQSHHYRAKISRDLKKTLIAGLTSKQYLKQKKPYLTIRISLPRKGLAAIAGHICTRTANFVQAVANKFFREELSNGYVILSMIRTIMRYRSAMLMWKQSDEQAKKYIISQKKLTNYYPVCYTTDYEVVFWLFIAFIKTGGSI